MAALQQLVDARQVAGLRGMSPAQLFGLKAADTETQQA
jgi:hypothetical protein